MNLLRTHLKSRQCLGTFNGSLLPLMRNLNHVPWDSKCHPTRVLLCWPECLLSRPLPAECQPQEAVLRLLSLSPLFSSKEWKLAAPPLWGLRQSH